MANRTYVPRFICTLNSVSECQLSRIQMLGNEGHVWIYVPKELLKSPDNNFSSVIAVPARELPVDASVVSSSAPFLRPHECEGSRS